MARLAALALGVAIVCVTAKAFEVGAYRADRVSAFRTALVSEFGLPAAGSYGRQCTDGCALGHSIGQLIRLPFHDAAGGGGAGGLGGPNGCIDPAAADNAGLAPVVARVTAVRDATAPEVTLADAFVLAGNLAIEVATTLDPADAGNLGRLGIEPPTPLVLPFRSGRNDTAVCSGVDAPLLPLTSSKWSGSLAAHSISSVFGRMGLTNADIVALMGAHTVGRLTAVNSGINGVWVKDTSASFSNRYYRDLVGVPWQKNTAQSNDVWLAGPANAAVPGVMLRTDVELIFNTTTATGAATCPTFNFNRGNNAGCPQQAATVASVQLYANSQAAWHAAFSAAWTKMVEFNTATLNSTTASTSSLPSPSVPPTTSDDSAAWKIPVAAAGGALGGLLLIAAVVVLIKKAAKPASPIKSAVAPPLPRDAP